MGFLLGRGLSISSREDFLMVLLWIIILFVSILIHELGHALTSLKMTGVNPSIKLWGMGGLAYPNTQLTRKQSFWVTWAGPLAGLSFFVIIVLICCIIYGFKVGPNLTMFLLFPSTEVYRETVVALRGMNDSVYYMVRQLFWVNFWWSLVNLLPVFPLDGGQIYASVEQSPKKVWTVGMITGGLVAIAALVFLQSIFIAVMFGYFAFQNYRRLEQMNGGHR
ncbi:MAG: site-2 protease family protein [Akkermansiaceae bacterium]